MQGAGINPARIQSVLRQATDDQLMMMLRRPDKVPSMFVQQEIARRRNMRMAASAEMSKQQPMQQPMQQPIGMSNGGPGSYPFNKDLRFDPKNPFGYTPFGAPDVQQSTTMMMGEPMQMTTIRPKNVKEDYLFPQAQVGKMQGNLSPVYTQGGFRRRENFMESNLDPDADKNNNQVSRFTDVPLPEEDLGFKVTSRPAKEDEVIPSGVGSLEAAEKSGKKGGGQLGLSTTDIYKMAGIDIDNINVNAAVPDTTAIKNELSNLKTKTEQNFESGKALLGDQASRIKGSITDLGNLTNDAVNNLELTKKGILATFDADELKKLKALETDHYKKAIEFIENDKEISKKQQQLIEAMSPKQNPTQRFFGYLAQIGADIMASDKDSFLQAGGEALSKAIENYKFDNEKDRENYVNSAKLMLEFEYAKRNNTIQAMDMKAKLYGQDIKNFLDIQEYKRGALETEQKYDTGILTLKSDFVKSKEQFNQALDKNMLQSLELDTNNFKNLFAITEGMNNIEQQDFTNQLNLAKTKTDIAQTMMSAIPNSVKEFNFAQSLPDNLRKEYLATITTASKSGITPDVTARAIMNQTLDRIKEREKGIYATEPEKAAESILGKDLYDAVKTNDGKVDVNKLYQHYFYGTTNIMLGNAPAQASNVISSDQYKAITG